jgi:ketosteroid isomerase-like protein
MVEVFDTGAVDRVSEFVHVDYLDHQGLGGEPIRGAAGFSLVVRTARSGYEALRVTIEDLIEEGDRVAARLRWFGTRASGEAVERETLEIIHVRDGMATEHWGGRS